MGWQYDAHVDVEVNPHYWVLMKRHCLLIYRLPLLQLIKSRYFSIFTIMHPYRPPSGPEVPGSIGNMKEG